MQFGTETLEGITQKYKQLEDIEDEQDWQEFMELFDEEKGILNDDIEHLKKKRKERWIHLRLNWAHHASQLLHEGNFVGEYRMSFNTWNKLYTILSPKLKRKRNVKASQMPVTIQLIIALGIRWLTGADINSCRHIFKMSRTEAYRCASKFLLAVLATKQLQIKLPKTPHQWNQVKKGFKKKSTRGVMDRCCGVLDGIFIKTIKPRYAEVSNVRAYYSGHYEHYGVNCQGMCDAYLRFLYFGVVSPGSTNDSVSYTRTDELKKEIENLDLGDYVLGDAAYNVTETLLVPFTGSQRDDPKQDAFNFYLSQLRIRIEMAFGLLVKKFSILQKPLRHRLKTVSK